MRCRIKMWMIIAILITMLASLGLGKIQRLESVYQITQQNEQMVLRREQYVKKPEYFSLESWIDDMDNKQLIQGMYRRKIYIRIKDFAFTNIIFCMVFSPILAFMTSIRLFGRCLFRLWNVITYIHRSDGEEDYLKFFHSYSFS